MRKFNTQAAALRLTEQGLHSKLYGKYSATPPSKKKIGKNAQDYFSV
ncbi:MAG: hypothetical protein LAP21_27480 [Acidobacteriia bacterium]|nr:hypothetical protein [Terriglobia bacterium]